MIDIHAHLAPGVDDGAIDEAEALELARMALVDGIEAIVATPHIMEGGFANDARSIAEGVGRLRNAVEEAGLDVQVVEGAEVLLSPGLVEKFQQGAYPALGKGNHVLVELPLQEMPPYTEEELFHLCVAGFTPILAHPERNLTVAEDPSLIYELVNRGVLVQVNAGSLTGHFGSLAQAVAELLLSHSLVHFIGSDAHSARRRPPLLSEAVTEAANLVGREKALRLVEENPGRVLEGGEIVFEEPEPISENAYPCKYLSARSRLNKHREPIFARGLWRARLPRFIGGYR